ncbi:hypothetical protein C8Q76DRAFT_349001 [Earliella scabrosa]|nr:hypothetical protein C8Q76DRAFT_349001 [Earliella scabrosa]
MTDRSVSMHNPNAKSQQHVSSRTGHFLQQQAYVAPPGPIPSLMSHELSARAAAVTSTFPSYCEPANAAPFSSGPEHDGHNLHVIPQVPYERGHRLPESSRLPTMEFYGYSLRDAIMGDTRSLVNRGEPAWPAGYKMPQKLAIAVHFEDYPLQRRQVTLTTREGNLLLRRRKPPVREKLAQAIAAQVADFLNKARDEYQKPLHWNGRILAMEDLVLVRVEHVSKGALQPVLAVRERTATAPPRPSAT